MEIHDLNTDNNVSENWFEATLSYGSGDLGTPGTNYDGILSMNESTIPVQFQLFLPYPNPFNPISTIRFNIGVETLHIATLVNTGTSSLHIYDINGKVVKTLLNNESLPPGHYEFQWNAHPHASGVYFVQLTDGKSSQIQKAVLIK